MLRLHVCRRLSDRLDGIATDPRVDRQAAHDVGGTGGRPRRALHRRRTHDVGNNPTRFNIYLYSRSPSVMGGTEQVQRNLIARRILGLPT